MKKYIFMRVLRSLLSIFLVTTLTYTIIYTMVPRKLISSRIPTITRLQRRQINETIMKIPFMSGWLYRVLRYQGVARKS